MQREQCRTLFLRAMEDTEHRIWPVYKILRKHIYHFAISVNLHGQKSRADEYDVLAIHANGLESGFGGTWYCYTFSIGITFKRRKGIRPEPNTHPPVTQTPL